MARPPRTPKRLAILTELEQRRLIEAAEYYAEVLDEQCRTRERMQTLRAVEALRGSVPAPHRLQS